MTSNVLEYTSSLQEPSFHMPWAASMWPTGELIWGSLAWPTWPKNDVVRDPLARPPSVAIEAVFKSEMLLGFSELFFIHRLLVLKIGSMSPPTSNFLIV